MNRLFQASIKENRQLTENHYLITLHPLKRIIEPEPGQFFMLSVDNRMDPLLKRPFSLHRWFGRDFQLLYRVVGKATNILKEKRDGDILEVIGPLGSGFPPTKKQDIPVLIGGGLGTVPLFALAEKLVKKKPLFFIGAKTKKEVLNLSALKSSGIHPVISTDDGSFGEKGFITDALKKFLTRHSSLATSHCLYACGPKPMLRELSLIVKKYKIKGYFALEENMACGLGACLSCVVNTKNGLKRVCKEGPVFPIDELIL